MADFKKAKFGDLFKFKTGEICEYIGKTADSVHLRPIDYKGLMVYSEVIDCPNAYINWKVYKEDDNWNAEENISEIETKNNTIYRALQYGDLQKLKEKIIEDCNTELSLVDYAKMMIILEERFGF